MKYKIPLIDVDVWFSSGVKGWELYIKEAKKQGFDEADLGEMPKNKGTGRCAGGVVWVCSYDDKKTIYHEMSHLCDNVLDHLGATEEKEFKAFIVSWLMFKSIEYYGSEE